MKRWWIYHRKIIKKKKLAEKNGDTFRYWNVKYDQNMFDVVYKNMMEGSKRKKMIGGLTEEEQKKIIELRKQGASWRDLARTANLKRYAWDSLIRTNKLTNNSIIWRTNKYKGVRYNFHSMKYWAEYFSPSTGKRIRLPLRETEEESAIERDKFIIKNEPVESHKKLLNFKDLIYPEIPKIEANRRESSICSGPYVVDVGEGKIARVSVKKGVGISLLAGSYISMGELYSKERKRLKKLIDAKMIISEGKHYKVLKTVNFTRPVHASKIIKGDMKATLDCLVTSFLPGALNIYGENVDDSNETLFGDPVWIDNISRGRKAKVVCLENKNIKRKTRLAGKQGIYHLDFKDIGGKKRTAAVEVNGCGIFLKRNSAISSKVVPSMPANGLKRRIKVLKNNLNGTYGGFILMNDLKCSSLCEAGEIIKGSHAPRKTEWVFTVSE